MLAFNQKKPCWSLETNLYKNTILTVDQILIALLTITHGVYCKRDDQGGLVTLLGSQSKRGSFGNLRVTDSTGSIFGTVREMYSIHSLVY